MRRISAPVVTSTDPEVVERLAYEVADLRAEVEHLRADRPSPNGHRIQPHAEDRPRPPRRRLRRRRANGSGEPEGPSGLVSRRRLFGVLGGAAAAGAGLAVVGSALGADRAGATDGGPLLIGSINQGTFHGQSTILVGDTADTGDASRPIFDVNPLLGFDIAGQEAIRGSCNGADSTVAVHGRTFSDANFGCGVRGEALDSGPGSTGAAGSGVEGTAFQVNGFGVKARATKGAAVLLVDDAETMPPTTGFWFNGSLVNSGGQFWYCYTGGTGTVSKWVNLTLSGKLTTISPARIYDSRVGQLPATGPKSQITNGNTVSVDVTGTQATPPGGPSGVPVGAKSVLGNITVINGSNPVFLTVFAEGATPPATSNVNAGGGVVVANSFTSQLGTSNGISIKCGGGPTDFIIDIFGYYP